MNEIAGHGFRLRRAGAEDVPFLVALANHEDVDPFMGIRAPRLPEEMLEAVARGAAAPTEYGRFVIEVDRDGWVAAGTLAFQVTLAHHRIAEIFGVMIDPVERGHRLAGSSARLLGEYLIAKVAYHRVEVETYGFNERAQLAFERAGFRRECVRRKRYLRHGEWTDGVTFALIAEDL